MGCVSDINVFVFSSIEVEGSVWWILGRQHVQLAADPPWQRCSRVEPVLRGGWRQENINESPPSLTCTINITFRISVVSAVSTGGGGALDGRAEAAGRLTPRCSIRRARRSPLVIPP